MSINIKIPEHKTVVINLMLVLSFVFLNGAIPMFIYLNLIKTDYGISLSQTSLLIALQLASTSIFSIPSGIISDKFSRKLIIQCCAILYVSSMLLMYCTKALWAFVLIHIMRGMAATALGVISAFIYNELERIKKHDTHYFKLEIFFSLAYVTGLAAGTILSALILHGKNYNPAILASILVYAMAFMVTIPIKESKTIARHNRGIPTRQVLSISYSFFKQRPRLVAFVAFHTALFTFGYVMIEFWTNLAHYLHWSKRAISIVSFLGLVLSGMALVTIRNKKLVLKKAIHINFFLVIATFITGCIICHTIPILLPISLSITAILSELSTVLSYVAIQRENTSTFKGTVLSMLEATSTFTIIVLLSIFSIIIALLENRLGIAIMILWIALLAALTISFLAFRRQKEQQEDEPSAHPTLQPILPHQDMQKV